MVKHKNIVESLASDIAIISTDLRYSASVQLLYTSLLFNKYLDLLLSRFNLNGARVAVILTLISHGGVLQAKDLIKFTLRSKQGISRLIAGLVKSGLVSKQQDMKDRRSFKIAITRQGLEMVGAILPVIIEAYGRIFSAVSEEEAQTLKITLRAIRKTLYKQLEAFASGKELVK